MRLSLTFVIGTTIAIGAGLWYWWESPAVRQATRAVGVPSHDSTPHTAETLAAAGVHKCRTASGIVYLDKPCPKGSTELAATGGAMTVVSFPKAPAAPKGEASGAIMKGFSREQVERMRDREIEAAANR